MAGRRICVPLCERKTKEGSYGANFSIEDRYFLSPLGRGDVLWR
jgi:hypothetical protein